LNNGIPSGHAWTALINSICNWIIWTSTIKNCPHIPYEMKRDYKLQVQGDDINIHANVDLSACDRKKIIEWMLIEFNYRASYEDKVSLKNVQKDGLNNSAFLKRIVNEKGLIDTPVSDIWEKILSGPEYSKCRHSRMTYLRRRLNDLCVFNKESREQLALYYSFIFNHPKIGVKVEQNLYRILFSLTNGFTSSLENKWEVYCKIFNVEPKNLISTANYYNTYINQLYEKNYLRYDEKHEYVDYWKGKKQSVSVSTILRNSTYIPLWYDKDMFAILHGKQQAKRRKRSPYCKKYKAKHNAAIKRLIAI
jgi:hypothetical protein